MLEKSGKAMPIPEGDTHICTLWYASDGLERPAKVSPRPRLRSARARVRARAATAVCPSRTTAASACPH
jgi:hypothetical protein